MFIFGSTFVFRQDINVFGFSERKTVGADNLARDIENKCTRNPKAKESCLLQVWESINSR